MLDILLILSDINNVNISDIRDYNCATWYSAVAWQPRTPRSGGGPDIRRGPTIYNVLVS